MRSTAMLGAVPGVYFYRTKNDWLMIGRSKNMPQRIKQHRTTEPDIEVVLDISTQYHIKCEAYFKEYFESKRITGTKECFDVQTDELKAFVQVWQEHERYDLPVAQEVAQLRKTVPQKVIREPDEESLAKYKEVKVLREQINRINLKLERAENELKKLIGTDSGIQGVATWPWREMPEFDEKRFKTEQREMYDRYSYQVCARKFEVA